MKVATFLDYVLSLQNAVIHKNKLCCKKDQGFVLLQGILSVHYHWYDEGACYYKRKAMLTTSSLLSIKSPNNHFRVSVLCEFDNRRVTGFLVSLTLHICSQSYVLKCFKHISYLVVQSL